MKKRISSGYSGKFNMELNPKNFDLSLLRRPLTPFTGFHEAKCAFDKGTAEVRHLLLHECGLIYECNICRNMFRSLANFISHKRVFCCKLSIEKHDSHDTTNETDSLKIGKTNVRTCVESKSEKEMRQKGVPKNTTRSVTSPDSEMDYSKKNEVKLEQTRSEEIPKDQKNVNQTSKQTTEQMSNQSSQLSRPTYVFQCPSCTLTFLKSSSVISHLAFAHNIPIRRIRIMRDSIVKRSVDSVGMLNDEQTINTKPNKELKKLQTSESTTNEVDELNANEAQDAIRCIFCQKSFERQASLSTHLQNCRIKQEMFESSEPSNKRVRRQSTLSKTSKEPAIAADIENNEDDDIKRTFANLEYQSFGAGLQTVSLDKLDISCGESTNASIAMEDEQPLKEKITPLETITIKTEATENTVTATSTSTPLSPLTPETPTPPLTSSNDNDDTLATVSFSSSSTKQQRRMRSNIVKQSCRCKICGKRFNALSNLRRHISMFHYRSRKFGCSLCEYCAFRRYDIINHLGFVHRVGIDDEADAAKLVRVNDVPYTKDDMDEDIVLCSGDEKEELNISKEEAVENDKSSDKRRRQRNKSVALPDDVEIPELVETGDSGTEIKLTRQKLKRTLSQISNNTSETVYLPTKSSQKRPTRNRTKPVNKDFVYDLNALVKKEQAQPGIAGTETETYHLRNSKRRNTLNAQSELPSVASFDAIKMKNFASIKGTARRACLLLISQGLAASSTLPEIPTERPQMRPRLISIQRSESQAGPIIETTELDAAERFKTLPLCDDSFLEKIAKESVGSFKMKPCLAQQHHHSALDTLLQKVDSSLHFLSGTARIAPIQVRTEINEPFLTTTTSLGSNNNNEAIRTFYRAPDQIIPKVLEPLKPQKRLPSLDRLAETINSLGNYYNAPVEH